MNRRDWPIVSHQLVDRIPLDLATAALVEFRQASGPTRLALNVPLDPYAVWLGKLEQYAALSLSGVAAATSSPAGRSLRGLRLLPMYRGLGEKAVVARWDGRDGRRAFDSGIADANGLGTEAARRRLRTGKR